MFHHKKNLMILLGLISLFLVILVFYICWYKSPHNLIKEKLGILLPVSSKILNFGYYPNGVYINAKISVESWEIKPFIAELNKLFGQNNKEFPTHYNFKNTCPWWDLNEDNIQMIYNSWITNYGSGPKGHNAWIFICKEIDGKNFVYIAY